MLEPLPKPFRLWSYNYYLNHFVYEVMILILSYNPTIRYYHSHSPSSIIVAIIDSYDFNHIYIIVLLLVVGC